MPEVRTLGRRIDSTGTPPPALVTLVYTTARAEPRLDWLLDDLETQARPGDDVELVVVDAIDRPASSIGYRAARPVARLVQSRPKPSPWQGPQRVAPRDFFAAASARNTGIALASRDYLVFLDDRCRLGAGWLARVRRAAAERDSVIAGAYDKADEPPIPDHRLAAFPAGRRGCGGAWLYGGNFAAPLSWLLEVNGFEEGTDGQGGEDYLLGHMLENRGRRVDFSAQMYVRKERPAGVHHGLPSRSEEGARARAALARFGKRTRTEFTPDLRELRARLAAGGRFPDVDPDTPHLDWYDGRPIREMT